MGKLSEVKLDRKPDGLAVGAPDAGLDPGESPDERVGRLYVASDIAAHDIVIPDEVFHAFRSSVGLGEVGSLSREEFAALVKQEFTSEKPKDESDR